MRFLIYFVCFVFLSGAAIFAFGPREMLTKDHDFSAGQIGGDLDGYLVREEGSVRGLRPMAAKEINWAGAAGAKTDLSIVYFHGFSASKQEIRPVPDLVAKALGANLYYARLTGHGQTGAALAAAKADDWWRDAAEAMAIANRLGDRVLLIGTSTGATLATLILDDPTLSETVVGMVGVAPNYRVLGAPMPVLRMPFANQIVPLIGGEIRSWAPMNDAQAKSWTTTYPTVAILPMATLVEAASDLDHSSIAQPALFLFSDDDEVVDHTRTREIAAVWGGGATIAHLTPAEGEAPSNHVITGAIVAPSTVDAAVEEILSWWAGQGQGVSN